MTKHELRFQNTHADAQPNYSNHISNQPLSEPSAEMDIATSTTITPLKYVSYAFCEISFSPSYDASCFSLKLSEQPQSSVEKGFFHPLYSFIG